MHSFEVTGLCTATLVSLARCLELGKKALDDEGREGGRKGRSKVRANKNKHALATCYFCTQDVSTCGLVHLILHWVARGKIQHISYIPQTKQRSSFQGELMLHLCNVTIICGTSLRITQVTQPYLLMFSLARKTLERNLSCSVQVCSWYKCACPRSCTPLIALDTVHERS